MLQRGSSFQRDRAQPNPIGSSVMTQSTFGSVWPLGSKLLCTLSLTLVLLSLVGVPFSQLGCSKSTVKTELVETPVVRVRLLASVESVRLTAGGAQQVMIGSSVADASQLTGRTFEVMVEQNGDEEAIWKVAQTRLTSGEMVITPESAGTLALGGRRYRGSLRLVAVGVGKFDVINDLTIDDYLKGVVPREMPAGWSLESLKAQATVARTYALFEAKSRVGRRSWDLFADTRSQVYGGMNDEHPSSSRAVDATSGLVLAAPDRGQLRIFKAYFSSCCGGVTQTAADAFNDVDAQVFSAQDVGDLCKESTKFRWPERTISKSELTRRIQLWGKNEKNPIARIGLIERIDVLRANSHGRPADYVLTDSSSGRFKLTSEQLRWAYNTGRPEAEQPLFSGFFTPVSQGNSIRITNGRGWGHGVGMCQWCTKARGDANMPFERIVRLAYPGAELVRAY